MDKADITKKLNTFIPSNLNYDVHEFVFEGSEYEKLQHKKFQLLIIPDTPGDLPFFAKKDGDDIKKDDIYYRHGTNTVKADSTQIKKLLARMIRTQTSDSELNLGEHFQQLNLLYTLIEKDKQVLISSTGGLAAALIPLGQAMEQIYGRREFKTVLNEFYPAESFRNILRRTLFCTQVQ